MDYTAGTTSVQDMTGAITKKPAIKIKAPKPTPEPEPDKKIATVRHIQWD